MMTSKRENLSMQMLRRFANQLVKVDTPVGQHGGVGNLLLQDPNGWLLIKTWFTIKRRI